MREIKTNRTGRPWKEFVFRRTSNQTAFSNRNQLRPFTPSWTLVRISHYFILMTFSFLIRHYYFSLAKDTIFCERVYFGRQFSIYSKFAHYMLSQLLQMSVKISSILQCPNINNIIHNNNSVYLWYL